MKPSTRFHISLAAFAVSTISFGAALAMLADSAMNDGNYTQLIPGCLMGFFISVISLGNVLRYGGPQ